MTAEELIKFHTQLIKDSNLNKWEVIEVSDLPEILEACLQEYKKELAEWLEENNDIVAAGNLRKMLLTKLKEDE